MIGIFVNHDLVPAPIPTICVGYIRIGNGEIETVKPKSVGSSASQTPDVAWAKSAREVAVLPGVIHVVVRISRTFVMAYPLVVSRIDVRRVGMSGGVMEIMVVLPAVIVMTHLGTVLVVGHLTATVLIMRHLAAPAALVGLRSVSRNVPPANIVASASLGSSSLVFMLGKRNKGEKQRRRKNSNRSFHSLSESRIHILDVHRPLSLSVLDSICRARLVLVRVIPKHRLDCKFMAESVEKRKGGGSRAVYWVLSLALAAILLYFSFRGIEWKQVWAILSSANVLKVLGSLALMVLSLFLRAYRWRVILLAETALSVSLAFWATSAGYLGNNVLPARAGEVIRSLMVSSRTGLSRAYVLTTALSERVVDAIAVISISSVVLLTLKQRPGWFAVTARPFAIAGFCGVAAIILIPSFEVFWFKFLGLLPIPPRLREQVEGILRQGLQGIRSFHQRDRLARFILLTAVIWFCDAVTSVVLAGSIGISMTLPMAFLLTAGLALGSALPSTPGYVGIYQFVAVSILTPFGFSRTDSIAYILLFQASNYVIVLTFGGVGFALGRRPSAAATLEA